MDETANDAVLTSSATPDQRGLSDEDRRILAEADEQFIGSFNHTVDGKGRMVVPLSFRQMLGEKFYIAPSYDFRAVGLYTKLSWARTRHKYASLDPVSEDVLMWVENFNAFSFRDQECDGQGRILLPTQLRDALLGEEKELIVSGAGDYVRVVGAKAQAEQFGTFRSRMPDILKNMNQLRARSLQL